MVKKSIRKIVLTQRVSVLVPEFDGCVWIRERDLFWKLTGSLRREGKVQDELKRETKNRTEMTKAVQRRNLRKLGLEKYRNQ